MATARSITGNLRLEPTNRDLGVKPGGGRDRGGALRARA